MKIYFCPECGAYDLNLDTVCDECDASIPEDSWADVTEDELQQLDYVDEFDYTPGLPTWEYEVIKLKSEEDETGLNYNLLLLNNMGDKAWELVSIVPLGDKDGPRYAVFKRAWLEEFED